MDFEAAARLAVLLVVLFVLSVVVGAFALGLAL